MNFGVVAYLIKPLEFERFEDSLKKYLNKYELLQEQKKLSQRELDELFKRNDENVRMEEISKGLTKTTLQKIVNTILMNKKNKFSTEELAKEVGISHISIGKNLSF